MAWVEVLFEEETTFVADDIFDSECEGSYTYVAQHVTGSLDPTVQINGVRVTFNTGINPFHYGDTLWSTSCTWRDEGDGESAFFLIMKVFGPELALNGQALYIDDIDISHDGYGNILGMVAELDIVAMEGPESIFQFLSAFEFTFYKRDVLTGSFVTSVEFDMATAAGFWTDYKDTRELC